MYSLETERLLLRPFTSNDLGFLVALHGDPDVARYIGYGKPRSEAESRNWLRATLDAYETDQLGPLAVVAKATGTLVGRCGLSLLELETGSTLAPGRLARCFWYRGSAPAGLPVEYAVEVGYTFARAAWGQGFATESARALRDLAFRANERDHVRSIIFRDNSASQNVARKLGMTPRRQVLAFGTLADSYEITRKEWEHLRDRPTDGEQ